jgi:hypothetical protein
MKGFQDLSLTGKYAFLERPFTSYGAIRAIAVVTGGIPMTDYTPDYQPLSIGMGAKSIAARFTLNFQSRRGWFVNGSSAHTWRSDVTLDRPFYFTEDRLFLTDKVDMPGIFDYVVSAGYLKHGLNTEMSFKQQRTQGGGDIRRQDMPFVSNRMNYSRVGVMALYAIPKMRRLEAKVAFATTVEGRNVGQGTSLAVALQYRFSFREGGLR